MKRMLFTAALLLIAMSASAAITLPDCGAGSATVLKNQPCELKLVATTSPANPYLSQNVTGQFKYVPTGQIYSVIGFYDGQQSGFPVFRLRFTPMQSGSWTWKTTSNEPSLVKTETSFQVGTSSARGFLRRTGASPQEDMEFDDGTHPFIWGTTYYQILNTARNPSGTFWKTAIDNVNAKGINKVRLLVFPWWDTYNGLINGVYTDSVPFQQKPPAQCSGIDPRICLNHDSIEWNHFRTLDDVVKYLYDRGIIAELIIFKDAAKSNGNIIDGNRTYGTTDAQDQRYTRYVVARYGAFTNVIWCLTNEWGLATGSKPSSYWITRGQDVRSADPFFVSPTNLVRLSSIHNINNTTFQFFAQRADAFNAPNWASHAVVQYHLGTDPAEWGNLSIRSNVGQSMPVFNDEFGYAGNLSRDTVREASWGVAVAGGYGTMGDTRIVGTTNAQTIMRAEWVAANVIEYDDTKLLIDFFKSNANFYKMSYQNIVTNGGRAYAMGETGVQYVFFDADGGTITANLPAPVGGTHYNVQSYNAIAGSAGAGTYTPLGSVNAGTNVALPFTSGPDSVLLLQSAP